MKKDPVHLVCASNSGFIMPLCVMLTSVVDNFNRERDLVIHIISSDATTRHRENVRESIQMIRPELDHIEIHWYAIDSALLNRLPNMEGNRMTREVYARLLISYFLPTSIERVIYLDCDMVVLADISELYDSTVGSPSVLHAVHDMGNPTVSCPGGVFDYVERGISPSAPYFNSGTLVINLKLWRERDLTPPMLEYMANHADRICFVDQGVLNAFLHDDWTPLDFRWNQIPAILYEKNWIRGGYTRKDWLHAKNKPYIVHYVSSKKPWVSGWRHAPRRIFFFRYLQKTVFKNTVPRFPYLENIMGFRAYYCLWKIGDKMFPQGFRIRPKLQNSG